MIMRTVFAGMMAGAALLAGYLFTLYQNPVFQIYLESWGLC